MSLKARRELIASIRCHYRTAGRRGKSRILDEFTRATGYNRKYAVTLLTSEDPDEPSAGARRGRPPMYGEDVRSTVVLLWEVAGQICSKRLTPFIPVLVDALERHGHLSLSPDLREGIMTISAATIDRILRRVRYGDEGQSLGVTRPGALVKHQIPIRTFADWDDLTLGFFETDIVAHCGMVNAGSYLNTLVVTDVASGWTECVALPARDQTLVVEAIRHLRKRIPFPLLGIDSDNGKEFINNTLLTFCREESITFTRGRPYKKNDQCHVEQKNGSIVRRLIGYDRFEGMESCKILALLYGRLRLYVNFFQPSLKLKSKTRQGSHVSKRYDSARTPYERIHASDDLSQTAKDRLAKKFMSLDPVALLDEIEDLKTRLWSRACTEPSSYKCRDLDLTDDLAKTASVAELLSQESSGDGNGSIHHRAGRKGQTYRRSKRKRAPRTWRSRADPFERAWAELTERLEELPETTAKELLVWLQKRYPGKYPDHHLRTLQRRVKDWRKQQAEAILTIDKS